MGAYQAEIEAGVRFGNMWTKLALNQQKTGWISGLAVTEDPTDLTVDLAAGSYVIDGVHYTLAADGDADTLEPDTSTRRMAILAVNAAGTVQFFHGDAASLDADGNELSAPIPDIGEYAPIKGYILKAGQLLASDYYLAFDLRIPYRHAFVVRKSADETKDDDVVFADDTHLAGLKIGPSEVWQYEWHLRITTTSNAGFEATLTVPASATLSAVGTLGTASGVVNASTTTSGDTAFLQSANGVVVEANIWATVENSTTAGTVDLQWCQGTTHADDTVVHEGSYVVARYIGQAA